MNTRIPTWLPAALKALVLALTNLQTLIGLVMIFAGTALLWRPAAAMLVVGVLLALPEIVSTFRGRSD